MRTAPPERSLLQGSSQTAASAPSKCWCKAQLLQREKEGRDSKLRGDSKLEAALCASPTGWRGSSSRSDSVPGMSHRCQDFPCWHTGAAEGATQEPGAFLLLHVLPGSSQLQSLTQLGSAAAPASPPHPVERAPCRQNFQTPNASATPF